MGSHILSQSGDNPRGRPISNEKDQETPVSQIKIKLVLAVHFLNTHLAMASLATFGAAASTVNGLAGSSITGTRIHFKQSRAAFRPTNSR